LEKRFLLYLGERMKRKEKVKQCWPEKITVEEFFKEVFNDSGIKTFVNNAKILKDTKGKKLFAEQWIGKFLIYMSLK